MKRVLVLSAFVLGIGCGGDGDGQKAGGGNMPPPNTVPPGAAPLGPTTPPPPVVTGGSGGTTPPANPPPGGVGGVGGSAPPPVVPPDGGTPPTPDAGPTTPTDLGPINTAPVTFGENVKVSDDAGRGQQAEVVLAAHPSGRLAAGWMDQRGGQGRCGFSVSEDGVTWTPTELVATQATSGGPFAGDPGISMDDEGNVYAVCQDYASGGLGTNYMMFGRSMDGGKTWSDFERMNQSLDKPWVGATEDGTVYVTWLGNPGGFKRSTDYGDTWGAPISFGFINHGTAISTGIGGIVHIAYNTNENTVTYRRSKDYGKTLEAAKNLAPQGRPCRSPCNPRSHPIVANASDPTGKVVAVAWASTLTHPDSEGDDDVWVIVSTDGGDTFSDTIRVNDNTTASRQFQPWVAVDAHGAVHVNWTDMRNGRNDTYYARMVDFDAGFEPNVQINDSTGMANSFLGDYKGIAVQGPDVVVLWADTRADMGDVYFARAKGAAHAGGPLYEP